MSAVSLGDIDRMIENTIVKALHGISWYPDKEKFVQDIIDATPPEQEIIRAAFQAEKQALADNGTLANVFGVGNYKDRTELKENNIIIDREGISPSINNFTSRGVSFEEYQIEEDGVLKTKYNKSLVAITPEDIEYSVSVVCEVSQSERVLSNMMLAQFGNRVRMIPYQQNWIPYDFNVLVERVAVANLSGTDYMERLFRYVVRDVVLDAGIVLDPAVPIIEDFEIGFNANMNIDKGLEDVDGDIPIDLDL